MVKLFMVKESQYILRSGKYELIRQRGKNFRKAGGCVGMRSLFEQELPGAASREQYSATIFGCESAIIQNAWK
jgi:hypothetical protein